MCIRHSDRRGIKGWSVPLSARSAKLVLLSTVLANLPINTNIQVVG